MSRSGNRTSIPAPPVFAYGNASTLATNLLNNIPLTLAFASVVENLSGPALMAVQLFVPVSKTYRRAEKGKMLRYPSQTALARVLNVTPARLNQYLRLLNLPESVQEEVLREKIRHSERELRGLLAGETALPRP